MKDLLPVLMAPYLKNAIWGGTELITKFGKGKNMSSLAESWELSNYPGAMSCAAGSKFSGKTFGELHEAFAPGREAVLIKFIDSAADLSVQVHPSESMDNDLPKNECWYIVSAKADSRIAYGLKYALSAEELALAINEGTIEEKLNYVNVKPGDFFYVPAGLVHAIGKGITLLEIQQTSDSTFRLYDYGRRDASGNFRELHIEKACAAFKNFTEDEILKARYSECPDRAFPECICNNDFFSVYDIKGSMNTADFCGCERAAVFLSDGTLNCGSEVLNARFGETYYLPPGCIPEICAEHVILTVF